MDSELPQAHEMLSWKLEVERYQLRHLFKDEWEDHFVGDPFSVYRPNRYNCYKFLQRA